MLIEVLSNQEIASIEECKLEEFWNFSGKTLIAARWTS